MANPSTRCWRCGLTLAEIRARTPRSKRVVWQAGHTVDGDNSFPLAAECNVCNEAAGARYGNRKRGLNPSRKWF
jgi:hypothetical protein